jgi:lysophospholipase L1-like esterase
LLAVGLLALLGTIPAYLFYDEFRKVQSEDPEVWKDDIAGLVEGTRRRGELPDAVLFVGSSSVRFWRTLERDMQPLVTIRHGFGGAKLADLEFYAEQLVSAFGPRAVVVFAGTNDLHPGNTKPPEVLLETYRRFIARVRTDLPLVPIYYIGITPTPMRWEVWDAIRETNRLIREYCEEEAGLNYIETGPLLLGADGTPNRDNYRFDGLHLSARGYAIWTDVIRARLMEDLNVDAID